MNLYGLQSIGFQWEVPRLFNVSSAHGPRTCKRRKSDPYLTLNPKCTQNWSWSVIWEVKQEHLGENIGFNLPGLRYGSGFFNRTANADATKEKWGKMDFIKAKRLFMEVKSLWVSRIRDCVSMMHLPVCTQILLQLSNQKTAQPTQNKQRTWIDIPPKIYANSRQAYWKMSNIIRYWEMQTITTMRFHLACVRKATIKPINRQVTHFCCWASGSYNCYPFPVGT